MLCRQLLLVVVNTFVILQPIKGAAFGKGHCSAMFDSEYEDACLRGSRMKSEAHKHGFEDHNGVTCENSCSDIYKDKSKLAVACKYGCKINSLAPVEDHLGNVWDQMNKIVMDELNKITSFFSVKQTSTSGSTKPLDQEKSEDKKDGAVIRRIHVFMPLDHPELATIQRSTQTLADGEDLFDRIKKLVRFPSFGLHADDRTVKGEDQHMPHHHRHSMHNIHAMMHPEHHEERDISSIANFIHLNPITVMLSLVLFLIVIFLTFTAILQFRRRSTSHSYVYTSLPTDAEEVLPYYSADLEGKKKGENKAENLKDAKEALGV